MDWLRDTLATSFEREASQYLKNPWQARNSYIDLILDRSKENADRFLSEQASRPLSDSEKRQVMKLLEMQRQAMLMYTSCGWFFDEISGLEARQVITYAARAMQLAHDVFGSELQDQYKEKLTHAPSNLPQFENGAKVYDIFITPAVVDLAKIGAQHTILTLFSGQQAAAVSTAQKDSCCFKVTDEELERREAGKFRLTVSRSKIQSEITLDEETFGCAAVWLGDHNVSCGVKRNMPEEIYRSMLKEMIESFEKGQINETIQLLPKHFEESNYSLKDMFKDDQRRILDVILEGAVKKAIELYEIIYKDNSALLRFMNETRLPKPKPFQAAAEIMLSADIRYILASEDVDVESFARMVSDAKSLSIELDYELIALKASERVAEELARSMESPHDVKRLENIDKLVKVFNELPVRLNLWQSQNIAFKIAEKIYKPMKEKADKKSRAWVAAFERVCESIGIRLA